jgi:hypothetical protein
LIWAGEKVFCDTRVAVYYSHDDETNILRQHVLARDALRGRHRTESQSLSALPKRESWSKTFDQHQITHVVVRLANGPDYDMLIELLQQQNAKQQPNWEWTGLGASTAVFYRATVKDADQNAYQAYVDAHKIDFRKLAYDDTLAKRDADQIHNGRQRPIRAPSFYKKYFWSTKFESSAEVREALQLSALTEFNVPRLNEARTAMAYLAIRRAQVGLAKDPDDVRGYLALGQAYDFLSKIEYQASLGLRQPRNGVRYLQAVAAYNQALVGELDNMVAHRKLLQLYQEAGKLDLSFRHLSALDDDILAHPDAYTDEFSKSVSHQIRELTKALKQVEEAVSQAGDATADGKNTMARLQTYLQRNCPLKALAELERDGKQAAASAQLEQLRIRLLLETGRVEEAYDAASRFTAMAEMQGVAGWADNVSTVYLTQGDYDNAVKYWEFGSSEIDNFALRLLLMTLPPRTMDVSAPWPLSTTNSVVSYFFQSPEQCAGLKINAALGLLEEGRTKDADRAFHELLEISPDTSLRTLVRFYLSEVTYGAELIDIFPPSNRIVELFTPEPGE